MGKFYELSEPSGIQNDHDLRLALLHKIKKAIIELKTIIDNNKEIYKVVTLQYGEGAFNDYPNRGFILRFTLYLDAFTGLIVNNLCALLGKGKNDTLSLYKHKKLYDETGIDAFYSRHEEKLKNLAMARDKVYAHIDTNVTDQAFLIDIIFFENCVKFAEKILKGGQKDE